MSIDFQKLLDDVAATRQLVEILFERLNEQQSDIKSTDEEIPIMIQEAADFLKVSKQTVYQNIDKIPHRKRHGRLYFYRSELVEYLNRVG